MQPQINANERKSIQEKPMRMNRLFRLICVRSRSFAAKKKISS